MRHLLTHLAPAAIALCLLLGGCTQSAADRPFQTGDAQTLLDSGAFSEPLEAMDQELACGTLYQIDSATVTECAVYTTLTAGAEELAILVLQDETAAQTAMTALEQRVADQKAALADYQPDEVGKLDNAILERRENTVLLLVPADADAAQSALAALS